jgi:hypothetical protein
MGRDNNCWSVEDSPDGVECQEYLKAIQGRGQTA